MLSIVRSHLMLLLTLWMFVCLDLKIFSAVLNLLTYNNATFFDINRCNCYKGRIKKRGEMTDPGSHTSTTANTFVIGDKVFGCWNGDGKWYPGKIKRMKEVQGETSYDVIFDIGGLWYVALCTALQPIQRCQLTFSFLIFFFLFFFFFFF